MLVAVRVVLQLVALLEGMAGRRRSMIPPLGIHGILVAAACDFTVSVTSPWLAANKNCLSEWAGLAGSVRP